MQFRILLALSLLLAACATPEPPRELLGPYRLDSGEVVSISRSADGTLRYRAFTTGSSGRLYPNGDGSYTSGDGFSNKEPAELSVRFEYGDDGIVQSMLWSPTSGQVSSAARIGEERFLEFENEDASFHARLQLPGGPGPFPAVVLVHGSGSSPGTEWFYNSDFFAANGVAALTFDKRGSGQSNGEFTFDFHQLARDVIAAVDMLASQPEIDGQRVGLSGYSQGAWVAPLASSMSESVSFVIVNYGMIESPAEEARLEMRQLLIDANVSDEELAEADELIGAAVELVANQLDSGWEEFDSMKEKYGDASWMVHLRGTPVDRLVSYPKFLVNAISGFLLPNELDWHYDSTELLTASDTPMVWLLAEQDRSAPNEQTVKTPMLKFLEGGTFSTSPGAKSQAVFHFHWLVGGSPNSGDCSPRSWPWPAI